VDFQFEKHFTLAQANSLIPAVRKVFTHVHALVRPGGGAATPGPNGNGHSNGNGNGNGHSKHSKSAEAVSYEHMTLEQRAEAAQALLRGLERKGIVIQDFTRGLIDFPSIREGREVFLCYELADGDHIHCYHELDAGYAGRTPL
jgi:hypothetical protein